MQWQLDIPARVLFCTWHKGWRGSQRTTPCASLGPDMCTGAWSEGCWYHAPPGGTEHRWPTSPN